jgi:glycosyltransferase involved in cell wall biosynthesis
LCPRSTMFANGANCERQHVTCTVYSWPRIKLSSHVSAVVGVSQFVLDRHMSHGVFRHATTFLIGNPCVPNMSCSEPRDATSRPFRIGYLGRLEPAKGVEHLLRAVEELSTSTWELHVAGRGTSDFERHLHSRFADPRIHFHGFVNREDLLHDLDILAVPSLSHETFGLVAVEAFAAGVPVVASRRGGLSEVVTDGVTGAVFEPNRPGELRAVLESFVSEPRRAWQMRARCLERARDFEATAITKRYEAVYQQVVRT